MIHRKWKLGGLLVLAGCGWGQEACHLPEQPVIQYVVQLLGASGQDLFQPGSGFSPDSLRFYQPNAAGLLQPRVLPVVRVGGTVQIGPISQQLAATPTSISLPAAPNDSRPQYIDLLIRLNQQETDTLTIVSRAEFRGGDECGQLVTTRLQFYYNGRLNATYSLVAPDTVRAFTAPAAPTVPLRKLR